MGDNENIEIVSPTEESNVFNNCDVDLSPIIEALKDLAIKQGEIIENQNKVIKYFVPTEEENTLLLYFDFLLFPLAL